MRFLADNMLGRLATWLRLLGYDTAYPRNAEDAELARIARSEERVLLTRDVELTRRRGISCLLIESEQVAIQVKQVFSAFHLTVHDAFSRCAECNVRLEDVPKESVRDRVPPYVFKTQERFRCCRECARVYWRGTHWARMSAQLEDLDGDDAAEIRTTCTE
jgi:uncharacterized protein